MLQLEKVRTFVLSSAYDFNDFPLFVPFLDLHIPIEEFQQTCSSFSCPQRFAPVSALDFTS